MSFKLINEKKKCLLKIHCSDLNLEEVIKFCNYVMEKVNNKNFKIDEYLYKEKKNETGLYK